MPQLAFNRVSDDGAHLVLTGPDGREYVVVISDEMRERISAGGPTRAASIQMRIPVNGPVTPKDVQRMIRHGVSLDDVAAESGMPMDKIENFAVPVLQERSFMADRARQCAVPAADTLAGAVRAKLITRGVLDEPAWDAWRRADGTWTVVARYPADAGAVSTSEETASFLFDPKSRSVVPENDNARWLTNTTEPAEPSPANVVVIDDVDETSVFGPVATRGTRQGPRAVPTQIDLADGEPDSAPQATPQLTPAHAQSESGKPVSRRMARRRASRRTADRREPTWDEILFGVSRQDRPSDEE